MAATDIRVMDDTGNVALTTITLTNGDGLPVVNLADSACKGVAALAADLSTARPIFIGAWASTGIAGATPVQEGQLTALKATADGRLITLPYCNPEDVIKTGPVVMANDASSHELVAGITGYKIAMAGLLISTLGSAVHLILSTASLTLARVPLVNVPVIFTLPLVTATNEAIDYQLSAGVGANTAWVTPLCYKTKLY